MFTRLNYFNKRETHTVRGRVVLVKVNYSKCLLMTEEERQEVSVLVVIFYVRGSESIGVMGIHISEVG